MQLQYCDGCNLRVDAGKAVTVGEKVYCPDCAAKLQAPRATPGASGTRAAARPPTAMHRATAVPPARAPTGAVTRPPTSGVQYKVSSRSASGQPGPPGPAVSHSTSRREAAADSGSKMMTWWLAAAGLTLALVGLLLILRGGSGSPRAGAPEVAKRGAPLPDAPTPYSSRPAVPDPRPPGGPSPAAGPADLRTPPVPDRPAPAPPRDETPSAPAKPAGPAMLTGGMDDMRETLARQEFDKLMDLEKTGKGNPFDMRRRWENFIAGSYGRMKAGREAEEHLKTLPVLTTRPPDKPPQTEPGLSALAHEKGWEDISLTGVSLGAFKHICTKTVPNLDHPEKGRVGEIANGRQDHIVIRFTGFVEAPRDGNYTFYTNSDDGSMLYIGDTLVVRNDDKHPMQERSGELSLQAGKHEIRVDFFQGDGGAGIIASWSGPDIPKQTIPASALSH